MDLSACPTYITSTLTLYLQMWYYPWYSNVACTKYRAEAYIEMIFYHTQKFSVKRQQFQFIKSLILFTFYTVRASKVWTNSKMCPDLWPNLTTGMALPWSMVKMPFLDARIASLGVKLSVSHFGKFCKPRTKIQPRTDTTKYQSI